MGNFSEVQVMASNAERLLLRNIWVYDNEQIKADFEELYRQMNGMPLREMDQIVYPVCTLCQDHERASFVEGIKIGIRLQTELGE